MAICEYLNEVYPDTPLLPKDPLTKAQVRAFCELINSGMQPLINLKVLQAIEERQIDRIEWAKKWLNPGFKGNIMIYYY